MMSARYSLAVVLSVVVVVVAGWEGGRVEEECGRGVLGAPRTLFVKLVGVRDVANLRGWLQGLAGEVLPAGARLVNAEVVRVHRGDVDVDMMVVVPEGGCSGLAADLHRVVSLFGKYGSVVTVALATPGGPPGYDTPEEIQARFQQLSDDNPSIASLIDLTEAYDMPPTVDGNHLFALKVSDNVAEDEGEEANVLFVANHHARELVTPEIALDTATKLVEWYANDTAVRRIVDRYQIYVMYTMNPDGLNYVWSVDNFWRKNRRLVGDDVYGVDLNRNYGFGWDFPCGGSTRPGSETYRGDAPFSEVETQTMRVFQRERRFAKVLDMHSYGRYSTKPYGPCAEAYPVRMFAMYEAHQLVYGKLTDYDVGLLSAMGEEPGYAFHDIGALAVLVETASAFQPDAGEMRDEVQRVWPGNLYLLSVPEPLTGYVTHAGVPVNVTVQVNNVDWDYDEQWENRADGRYHVWLPPGDYSISFTPNEPGYLVTTVNVTLPISSDTVELDVDMDASF